MSNEILFEFEIRVKEEMIEAVRSMAMMKSLKGVLYQYRKEMYTRFLEGLIEDLEEDSTDFEGMRVNEFNREEGTWRLVSFTEGNYYEFEKICELVRTSARSIGEFRLLRCLMDDEVIDGLNIKISQVKTEVNVKAGLISKLEDVDRKLKNKGISKETYNSYMSTHSNDGNGKRVLEFFEEYLETEKCFPKMLTELSDRDILKRTCNLFDEWDLPKSILNILTLPMLEYKNGQTPRPVIIIGPPGCGKTKLTKLIAEEVFGMPYTFINCAFAGLSGGLGGISSVYKSSQPGIVLREMIKNRCSNPVFVFDEVDKVTISGDCNISSELLSMCDGTRAVHDNFLDFDISLDGSFIFMTANEETKISEWLLDRCIVIRLKEASKEKLERISEKYLKRFLDDEICGRYLENDVGALLQAVNSYFAFGVRSIRQYEQLVENALNKALAQAVEQNRKIKVDFEFYRPFVETCENENELHRFGFAL